MTTRIVLEGIDGAGKSTVIEKLRSCLESRGKSTLLVDKHNLMFTDPADNERALALRELIWGIDKSVSEAARPKDAYFKFLIISSWYHLVTGFIRASLAEKSYDVVLIDGWYHRHVIKTALRSGQPVEDLMRIVEPITAEVPIDFHVFLDVSPEEASTRKNFRDHECGAWDGLGHLGPVAGFVAYQTRIRDAFLGYFPQFHRIANDFRRSPEETAEEFLIILDSKNLVPKSSFV